VRVFRAPGKCGNGRRYRHLPADAAERYFSAGPASMWRGVPLFYSLNIIATVPDEMAKSAKKRDKMANTAGKMAKFWYIKGGRR
jgi:hypothetical protein